MADAGYAYDGTGNRTAELDAQGDTLNVVQYNRLNLPEEYVSADGDTLKYVYSADGEKLYVEERSSSASGAQGTEYAANYRIENGEVTMIHTDAGYYTIATPPAGGTAPVFEHLWYLKDYLGNNRVLADAGGSMVGWKDYDPFGEEIAITVTNQSGLTIFGDYESPYRYGGKEWNAITSTYDFEARYLSPGFHRFTTMDPLAEKYYSISPYAYCAGNPVNLVDPEGCAPVYNQQGVFMGTDDEGLQGSAIIMSSDLFIQGMAHKEAQEYDLGFKGLSSVESAFAFLSSYSALSERPDYDGFVTIEEGIQWAKEHPGVLSSNNPEDALYFDASKVDFGNVSTEEFIESPQQINVFRGKSILSYMIHPAQRHSAYALGQVYMELLDREERSVRIINGKGTVYDWDLNGDFTRKALIFLERMRTGLNDSHGFRVYYYGTGYLKK